MVMPPRPSSGMQSIHRELQRRRSKTLAPKSSVAKKPSARPPPPPPREGARYTGWEPRPHPPRQEDPSSTALKPPPVSASTETPRLPQPRPHPLRRPTSVVPPSTPPPPREGDRCTGWEPCPRPARQEPDPEFTASKSPAGSAGTHAPRSQCPRRHPPPRPTAVSRSTPPPSSSALSSSSIGSACRATPGATAHLRPGTAVGVRTRTTTLKTGEALVLWLRAMIVSPTHGGYEVVYDGNWPPGNPYATVDVPRRHVRMIETSPSPTTTPPSLLPSSTPSSSGSYTTATVAAARREMRPTPRPTRAGKSLRLIRSLLPEMERQARAASPGY